MSKQTINIGTAANAKNGDSLRAAFNKVNANFTELYTALGLADTTLNLGAFTFTGSTMSTDDSTAIVIDKPITVNGEITVDGDITPSVANGSNLGSPTKPFRSLYVSNNTIFLGGTALSVNGAGNLLVNGSLITGGTTFATVATTGAYADLTGKPTIPTSFDRLVNGAYSVVVESTGAFKVNAQGIVSENQLAVEGDGLAQLQVADGSYISVWNQGNTKEINLVLVDNAEDPSQTWTFNTDRTLILPDDSRIKSATNIDITIDTPDSSTFNWRFGADGHLTLPAGGDIKDSTGTSVLGGGGSVSSLVNGAYTVSLSSAGVLTVPANGIITAPIAQEFQLQAKDANSVLRNEINLDPNNGTYMSVWRDSTTSFSSADWGSGSWNNEGGLGAARFTDAQGLQDFWLTGPGSLGLAYEVSINGGARTPNVFYDNNNGGGSGVLLGLDAVPPGGQGTTVPITSLVFYYQLQSKINMDVDGGEILVDAQAMDLDLRTTLNLDLRANQNLNLRGLGAYPVRVYTNNNTYMWEFGTDGKLRLANNTTLKDTAGNAIAFGYEAGLNSQSATAIAIGSSAGYYTQGAAAVAIGESAGESYQGANAIAIGKKAGYNNQAANSIIINATGDPLEQTTANTFTVAPIRNISATSGILQYNASTKEVSYSNSVTAERFNTDQITVVGNRITTTVTNANLELECNGSGGVVINAIADATTASTVKSVGYLGLPQSGTSTSATLAIGDAGKHIYVTTTGQAIAIPDNSSVAYPIGTTLTFIAGPSATTVLIVINTDTLRLAGSSSTGTRTLAANGMATAVKVASTLWYINGIGLT